LIEEKLNLLIGNLKINNMSLKNVSTYGTCRLSWKETLTLVENSKVEAIAWTRTGDDISWILCCFLAQKASW
jgi:hypothetical protein